jgi:predicted  nucleic acid-binding Zn-ribbon protein
MKLSNFFQARGRTDEEMSEEGVGGLLQDELTASLAGPDFSVPSSEEEFAQEFEGLEEELASDEAQASRDASVEADANRDADRTTQFTQASLASFAAFESLHQGAQEHIEALSSTLAKVTATHHLTREFLNMVHSIIHRGNELEVANGELLTENRRLARQAEHVNRLRGQYEALQEAYKRRESKLVNDAESLRVALGAAKLAAVDANNAVAAMETERAQMLNSLASNTSQVERLGRENEILRERLINLSADLESSAKKHDEIRRKYDELATVHEGQSAQFAESRSRLTEVEKEFVRLQKQHDGLQTRLTEANETIRSMEADVDDEAKRHRTEIQGMKSEIESLKAHMKVAGDKQRDAAGEMETLRARLKDVEAERRIAEDKLEALREENERAKSIAPSISDLGPMDQQGAVEIAAAAHARETEALRREIGSLKMAVKRLQPFEALYKSVKGRMADQPSTVPPAEQDQVEVPAITANAAE